MEEEIFDEYIPDVSVVIPLYNKEAYIARALESVLSQTMQNFEIIVVNDGSTDNSGHIVRNYSDPRIQVITQNNQGVHAARNRGANEARSDRIVFLDADDEWFPQFLEMVMRMKDRDSRLIWQWMSGRE